MLHKRYLFQLLLSLLESILTVFGMFSEYLLIPPPPHLIYWEITHWENLLDGIKTQYLRVLVSRH